MLGVPALELFPLILGEVEECGFCGHLVPEFAEQLDALGEVQLS